MGKGVKSLIGARAVFQARENVQGKWADASKPYRVVITLAGKENKPCYVYHEDADLCKGLTVKVKCVSNPTAAP